MKFWFFSSIFGNEPDQFTDEDASFKSLLLNFWQVNHHFSLPVFFKFFEIPICGTWWILNYSTQNHSEVKEIDNIKKF